MGHLHVFALQTLGLEHENTVAVVTVILSVWGRCTSSWSWVVYLLFVCRVFDQRSKDMKNLGQNSLSLHIWAGSVSGELHGLHAGSRNIPAKLRLRVIKVLGEKIRVASYKRCKIMDRNVRTLVSAFFCFWWIIKTKKIKSRWDCDSRRLYVYIHVVSVTFVCHCHKNCHEKLLFCIFALWCVLFQYKRYIIIFKYIKSCYAK